MKFQQIFTFLIWFFSIHANALTEVTVVRNYQNAEGLDWGRVPRGELPEELLATLTLEDPSRAYMAPYEKVFFQNERFVVCFETCQSEKNFQPQKARKQWIQLATVYYWVDALFKHLEKNGFEPLRNAKDRVTIVIDDPQYWADEASSPAVFDPSTLHLRFGAYPSPAGEAGRLSAAYDPSVILHEIGHYIYKLAGFHLYYLHTESAGMSEAFADTLATSFLGTAKIGLVHLAHAAGPIVGRAGLRDLDVPVQYRPGLRGHKLGHVVAYTFRLLRKALGTKYRPFSERLFLRAFAIMQEEVGQFASTAFLQESYERALAEILPGADDVKEAVAGVFEKVGIPKAKLKLEPSEISLLGGEIDDSQQRTFFYEYSLDAKKNSHWYYRVVEARSSPKNPEHTWYLISWIIEDAEYPLWIQYSNEHETILRILDYFSKKPVDLLKNMISAELSEEIYHMMPKVLGFYWRLGQDVLAEIRGDKGALVPEFGKATTVKTAIDGSEVDVNIHPLALRGATLAKKWQLWMNGTGDKALEFELITAAREDIWADRLAEVEELPGQVLLGYKRVFANGVFERVLMVDTGTDFE